MVLDHIFICVQPGAPEAENLKNFGLTEGSPNRHQGQGTANRRFFFQNAFLELLWLEDSGEAQSDVTRPTMLYERLRSQGQAVSPFGIGFRPAISNEKRVPFPSWSYKPLYLPADLTVEIGEGAPLSEPMWFFLSFGARPDSAPQERRQPVAHQTGYREVTSVRISLPKCEPLSAPAVCAMKLKNVRIVEGTSHLLDIGFDNETNGYSHDFRPLLPFVFRW
jgi:hypothetical protein